MKRSLLTYLAWISLVMISFSCRSPEITLTGNQVENYWISTDSGSSEKITYKASISYKDKELSGRVLIKKTDVESYRVAFYNEMGMTYLEGTLENKKLIIHNIIPALDNKIFLRKFKRSMKTVL